MCTATIAGCRRGPGILALSIVALSASAVACSREIRSDAPDGTQSAARPAVAVAAPEANPRRRFETNFYSEHDADLYNRLSVDGSSSSGIPVIAIHVEVGDRVRGGQLLATLEDSDARLRVASAEPEADVAAASLHRVEELRKTGVVTESEYDEAVYASRTADAALKQAQLNLSRTEIRAPFAGVVSQRYVRVGQVVDDETPLFRVTALAPLRARFLVPDADMAAFAVGAPVTVTGTDGATDTARVIIVGPTIDPGSGTREVIIELEQPGSFRPGASVVAEPVKETAETPSS